MGFGDDAQFFNLTVCFTLQLKNFLENFISQNSNDILVFSNDLSWKQKNIVCK
jgi:peroxiredoxin